MVRYESLTREPARTLKALYELLDEEPFEHDLDDVESDDIDYDKRIGLPGLHRVRRGVNYVEQPLAIPPDIFQSYAKANFWESPEENFRDVPIL